jgi:MOSC domain-containing protein YiiM
MPVNSQQPAPGAPTDPGHNTVAYEGRLISVNVGAAQTIVINGRRMRSGIGKRAVAGPVPVGQLGLAGDEQVELSIHGGPDKAVYAYPSEHMSFWQAQRLQHGVSLFDEPLPSGFVGENLSLQGLEESKVWIGDCLHFAGGLVLRVTEPRQPCGKFNAIMGYATASRDMALSGRCGFYLSVDTPAAVSAGEGLWIEHGSRSLTVASAFLGRRGKHLR